MDSGMILLLATLLESTVATTLLKHYVADYSLLSVAASLLAANLGLVAFYHVLIYPFFVSPLRHLPGPVRILSPRMHSAGHH
jgi:hypothetical protein